MTEPILVNLQTLLDDTKCYEFLRQLRWPEGISCPNCKSSDPNYMRTTVYLPRQVHRRLKSAAADKEKEISEIVEMLVEDWLASREKT